MFYKEPEKRRITFDEKYTVSKQQSCLGVLKRTVALPCHNSSEQIWYANCLSKQHKLVIS